MVNEVNSTQCTFMEILAATCWPNGGDTKINMMARAFKELSLMDCAVLDLAKEISLS